MKAILFILTLVLTQISFNAQTVISGFITDTVVWDSVNSPYIITTNVLVTDTAQLIILPGTIVKFDAQRAIEVDGEIKILGDSTSHVTFTANSSNPSDGFWKALILSSSAKSTWFSSELDSLGNDVYDYQSGCVIEYCDFIYGGYDSPSDNYDAILKVEGPSLLVRNCSFKQSGGYGVYFTSNVFSGLFMFVNNNIHTTFRAGLLCMGADALKDIRNNSITNCAAGIQVLSTNKAKIYNNILRGCSSFNIHCNAANHVEICKNVIIGGTSNSNAIVQIDDGNQFSNKIYGNIIIDHPNKSIFDADSVTNNVFINNGGILETHWYSNYQYKFYCNQFLQNNYYQGR